MEDQNKKGKILQFRQDSTFHLRRGDYHLEKNDPIQAVSHYRIAYAKNPKDPEVCMALADQLNMLHRYDESNRILFTYMGQYNAPADFFFGLACNFYGMCEYEYASDALYAYLQIAPEGRYAIEASEFLDVLEDDEELADAIGLDEDEDFDTVTICKRAQNLIASGETDVAEFLLQSYINEDMESWRIESLHAYTLFLLGKRAKAETLLKNVYERYPDNLSVRLDYVRMLHRNKKDDEAKELLDATEVKGCDDAGVWKNYADALYDLDMPEKALQAVREADAILPFDRDILHLMAYIQHEQGDCDAAIQCYTTLQKIEPDDIIPNFYLSALREEKKKGKKQEWSRVYALPVAETVQKLNEIVDSLCAPEQTDRWKNDKEFRNLLNWSLTYGTKEIRYMVLDYYGMMKDEAAETALRDYVLRMDQKDEDKKYALMKLDFISGKPPYMAYLDSQWIESRLSTTPFPENMPAGYKASIEHMLVCMDERHEGKNVAEAAMYILQGFLDKNEGVYPKLNMNQTDALAGAIHTFAAQLANEKIEPEEILELYSLTPVRLKNAMRLLTEAADEEEKE